VVGDASRAQEASFAGADVPVGATATRPWAAFEGGAVSHKSAEQGAPPVMPEHVVDNLVDALEQRVLAELERRGGRYAEVF
jgi:hypothetical protein